MFKGKDKMIHKLRRSLHNLVAAEVENRKATTPPLEPVRSASGISREVIHNEDGPPNQAKYYSPRVGDALHLTKSKSTFKPSNFSKEKEQEKGNLPPLLVS